MNDIVKSKEYAPSKELHQKFLDEKYFLRTKSLALGSFALIAVAVSTSLYVKYRTGEMHLIDTWWPLFGVIALAWLFQLFVRRKILKTATASIEDNTNTYKFEICRSEFSEKGSDGSYRVLPNKGLLKVDIFDEYIVVWENKAIIHVLPHYAFSTREDMILAGKLLKCDP